MASWIKVAASGELPAGTSREVVAGDCVIAVFNVNEEYFAMDGVCPHAGGPLAQGTVQSGVVTCPWHGWQFDVKTGRNCLNARITARSYPCKVENGDVFVEV
jgi:NAD(P)H-dependent nitrite reductase small subunit